MQVTQVELRLKSVLRTPACIVPGAAQSPPFILDVHPGQALRSRNLSGIAGINRIVLISLAAALPAFSENTMIAKHGSALLSAALLLLGLAPALRAQDPASQQQSTDQQEKD